MGTSKTGSVDEQLISLPDSPVGYVVVLFAVVTGSIHLLLAVKS